MDKNLAVIITDLSIELIRLKIETKALSELLVETTSLTSEDISAKRDFIEKRDHPDYKSKLRAPFADLINGTK